MSATEPTNEGTSRHSRSAVGWLAGVSVALLVLQSTVINASDLRAAFGADGGSPGSAIWTIATYPFVPASAWTVFVNVSVLWLFGTRLESLWGPRQFTVFFALCAFGAWFAHLLLVKNGVLIGSTGALLGVVLASTTRLTELPPLLPGMTPSRSRTLAIGASAALIGTAVLTQPGERIAALAHLSGAVFAWAYLRLVDSIHLERWRGHVSPVADEPEDMPPRAIPRTLPKSHTSDGREEQRDDIVAQSRAALAAAPAERTTRRADSRDAELNLLLDKISAHGIAALTDAERKRLEDAARKLRREDR